jgi:hypothetical protein
LRIFSDDIHNIAKHNSIFCNAHRRELCRHLLLSDGTKMVLHFHNIYGEGREPENMMARRL